jgi:hypothetical protein
VTEVCADETVASQATTNDDTDGMPLSYWIRFRSLVAPFPLCRRNESFYASSDCYAMSRDSLSRYDTRTTPGVLIHDSRINRTPKDDDALADR